MTHSQEEAFQLGVSKGMFNGLVSSGVVVSLPFPPSTNRLYRAVGGRSILSAEYRAWKTEAGLLLNSQRPKMMLGRVAVCVTLRDPNQRKRDADNSLKAVLDLLVTHQIIEADDNTCVRKATAEWVDSGDPCTVTITRA